jgi:hypothetical protein
METDETFETFFRVTRTAVSAVRVFLSGDAEKPQTATTEV